MGAKEYIRRVVNTRTHRQTDNSMVAGTVRRNQGPEAEVELSYSSLSVRGSLTAEPCGLTLIPNQGRGCWAESMSIQSPFEVNSPPWVRNLNSWKSGNWGLLDNTSVVTRPHPWGGGKGWAAVVTCRTAVLPAF